MRRGNREQETFICVCMDVTVKDLDRAIAAGFRDPESIKRFTGCLMGFCQGKSCLATLLELAAERTGSAAQLRQPTSRPPAYPVSLGTLAADDEAGD